MPFTPDNTVAVIVGIEDYEISKGLDAESRWDLDGPVSDAVQFARWLKGVRNVPPGNIHVFHSPLDRAAREVEFAALGIADLRDATQKTLENFFLNELAGLAPQEDGQLFLLWGGHGILRSAKHRHLYCADVLPKSVRTISLNDLLCLIAQMRGFERQYIFVDACANALEDTDLTKLLFTPLDPDKPSSGVEQYALLAASAGQLAVNQRDLHSGLFSTFLFEELKSLQDWPDFPALEKAMVERFAQRHAADPTFNQRPISLTATDHTNRSKTHNYGGTPVPQSLQTLARTTEYSVALLQNLAAAAGRCGSLANAAGRGHFYVQFGFPEPSFRADDEFDRLNLLGRVLLADRTADFLNELKSREPDLAAYAELGLAFQQAALVRKARSALRELKIETSEYRRLFSMLVPGAEASHLEAMLDMLAARGPLGSCSLFEFFFRVADNPKCLDPAPLRAWVKEYAEQQHYADLEQKRIQSRTYSIVVSVKPRSGKDEFPESFTAWLLENGRAVGQPWTEQVTGLEDIEERLEKVLTKAIESADGPVSIEIAVPMRLMRMNFDRLGVKHAKSAFKRLFGRDHPIIVRWRDRQKQNSIWASPWRNASDCIRGRLAAKGGAATPTWLPLPDNPNEEYLTGLEKPSAEFLFLGSPQPPPRDEDPDWLHEVIVAGIPFAGWMVKPPANFDKVPGLLDALIQGTFEQLPQRVPDVRRDSKCADLHSLILLWDDPQRRHTVLLEEPS